MVVFMKIRKIIGKITSPIFVPLRKLVVWSDNNFGTCDYKLVLAKRGGGVNEYYLGTMFSLWCQIPYPFINKKEGLCNVL